MIRQEQPFIKRLAWVHCLKLCLMACPLTEKRWMLQSWRQLFFRGLLMPVGSSREQCSWYV